MSTLPLLRSTPSPSASHGLFPSIALRRHQVCHLFQYNACGLPPTEASASVSTSLPTSSSFPPSPVCVPARWGLRGVHGSAFRVIASHIMSSMYPVGKFGCRIVSKDARPPSPIFCSLHCPCTRVCNFWAISVFGHLEMPSANTTFCRPGICFASWLHPLVISCLPRSLIAIEARRLCDPPHRLIHDTAATLSPPNSTGSPVMYAVMTIPPNSCKFIVIVSSPLVIVWFFESRDSTRGASRISSISSLLGKPPSLRPSRIVAKEVALHVHKIMRQETPRR